MIDLASRRPMCWRVLIRDRRGLHWRPTLHTSESEIAARIERLYPGAEIIDAIAQATLPHPDIGRPQKR